MSTSYLSNRVKSIGFSANASASLKAKELQGKGIDLIDLTIGEPSFDTPEYIKQAAIEALRDGKTKYIPAQGIAALRNAISHKLQKENNLSYSAEQISVANGAKQIIFNAIAATVDAGDEVIIPAPCWSTLVEVVKFNQGIPVVISAGSEQNYKILPWQVEAAITDRTKWLLLNSPNNPTGAVFSLDEWLALAEVLRRHPQVLVLVDEIYEHILFTNEALPNLLHVAPDLKDRVLIVNGFSKTFAMTGWRVGYGAGPTDLIKAMTVIQSQTTSGGSSISQAAALAALTRSADDQFVEKTRQEYQLRRDILVRALSDTRLSVVSPDGSFFVLPDWSEYHGWLTPEGKALITDQDFSDYLLQHAAVATISGDAFHAQGHIRLSIAADTDLVRKAGQRIATACAQLTRRTANVI